MNDNDTFLKQLRARGYDTEKSRGHWKIWWQGQLVATHGGTPSKNKRSLQNLRASIRRFERELTP